MTLEKQSGGKPAKKKAPIKKVEEIEEHFSGSDGDSEIGYDEINDTDNGIDGMVDIPCEKTSTVHLKKGASEVTVSASNNT